MSRGFVTDGRMAAAFHVVAQAVATHGHESMPVLDRFSDEMQKRDKMRQQLARVARSVEPPTIEHADMRQ